MTAKKQPPLITDETRYDVKLLVRNFEGGLPVAAQVFGVEVRTLHRWCNEGVNWIRADEIATACGRNAAEVWGDQWLDAVDLAAVPDTPLEEPGQVELFAVDRLTG